MPTGNHQIKVLNISNAEYHLYQAEVIRHSAGPRNTDDKIQLNLNRVTLANEEQTQQQLLAYRRTIEDLKTVLTGSKILLPDTFPYRSAAEALQYPDAFSSSFSHFLNNQHAGLQRAIFDTRAIAETLAANLQLGVNSIFSVTTSLSTGTSSTVVFSDGSQLKFNFNFTNDLTDGLLLNVTLANVPVATDANGKRIPHNPVEARNYVVDKNAIDLHALADYLAKIGIKIIDDKGGNICLPDSFSCSNDGKQCTVNYRC
ncbi:hypothetical protein AJE_08412 [Alishewanella jeotgali KCTC 22429]|uniref:Uncharacterized protein n=2 Tax=Alishewanella jeotgali TaxID=545533 RepID=H3ZEA0_9ALTE|nr:hypothetical protein AJE_08412 [Alishewanella jeotgali KCTC 22429]